MDKPLTRLLHDKKIVVGQKLIVCGAELVGSEQAVSPLEVHRYIVTCFCLTVDAQDENACLRNSTLIFMLFICLHWLIILAFLRSKH